MLSLGAGRIMVQTKPFGVIVHFDDPSLIDMLGTITKACVIRPFEQGGGDRAGVPARQVKEFRQLMAECCPPSSSVLAALKLTANRRSISSEDHVAAARVRSGFPFGKW